MRPSLGWTRKVSSVFVALVATVAVAACGGSAPSANPTIAATQIAAQPTAVPAPSPSPAPTIRPKCPNREGGGTCLGNLAAGTYTTILFEPVLTYTVPAGWANYEDETGNFLLIPPGYSIAGVNTDTGDFVGVYSTVAIPNGCNDGTAPGIGLTPAAMKAWYEANPGLVVTSKAATVGGRAGFVLDIRMAKTWTKSCSYSNGHPIVPLLVGIDSSGLDHNIGAGRAWRLYLLENGQNTMAIEMVDIADAGHLDTYSGIAEAMTFGPERP